MSLTDIQSIDWSMWTEAMDAIGASHAERAAALGWPLGTARAWYPRPPQAVIRLAVTDPQLRTVLWAAVLAATAERPSS